MNDIRRAIRTARKITGMLQGTMGLEGQGLDRGTLKAMTKQTARELLSAHRATNGLDKLHEVYAGGAA